MNLSEIFCSIQGESTYSGLPCIFIRLAGCNLRCNYCDSTYSYKTKFTATPEEIVNQIKKYNPIKLVEITGGEPLLQDEIIELFHRLKKEGYKILLETNGSVELKNVPKFLVSTPSNISLYERDFGNYIASVVKSKGKTFRFFFVGCIANHTTNKLSVSVINLLGTEKTVSLQLNDSAVQTNTIQNSGIWNTSFDIVPGDFYILKVNITSDNYFKQVSIQTKTDRDTYVGFFDSSMLVEENVYKDESMLNFDFVS